MSPLALAQNTSKCSHCRLSISAASCSSCSAVTFSVRNATTFSMPLSCAMSNLKRIADKEQIVFDDAVGIEDRDARIEAVEEEQERALIFPGATAVGEQDAGGSLIGIANRPRMMPLGVTPAAKCAAVSDDTPRPAPPHARPEGNQARPEPVLCIELGGIVSGTIAAALLHSIRRYCPRTQPPRAWNIARDKPPRYRDCCNLFDIILHLTLIQVDIL